MKRCPKCGTRYEWHGEADVHCPICPAPRGSKYGNRRTTVGGISFDSKKEAARFGELEMLRREGAVKWFIRQPVFDLPGGVTYRADFLVVWDGKAVTVEDVKGGQATKTQAYRIKKRQMLDVHGIEVWEL